MEKQLKPERISLKPIFVFIIIWSVLIAGSLIGGAVHNNHQNEYYDPSNGGYDIKYIVIRFVLALIFPALPISIVLSAPSFLLFYMFFFIYKKYLKPDTITPPCE